MKRRNFLTALGLGGAACALAPVAAVTAKSSEAIHTPKPGWPLKCQRVDPGTKLPTGSRPLTTMAAYDKEGDKDPDTAARLDSVPHYQLYYLDRDESEALAKMGAKLSYAVCWRALFTSPSYDDYDQEDGWIPVCTFDTREQAEDAIKVLTPIAWRNCLRMVVEYNQFEDGDFIEEVVRPAWREMTPEQRNRFIPADDYYEKYVIDNQPPSQPRGTADFEFIDQASHRDTLSPEDRLARDLQDFKDSREAYECEYLRGEDVPQDYETYDLVECTWCGAYDQDLIDVLRKHSDFDFYSVQRIGAVHGPTAVEPSEEPSDGN